MLLSRFSRRYLAGGLLLTVLSFAVGSCGSDAAKKLGNEIGKKGADPSPTSDPAGYSVAISAIAPVELITKSTAAVNDAVCTADFTVTVTKGGAAAANEAVTLSISSSASTQDVGKVEPATGTTDASGNLSAKYCGGDSETTVMVVAKAAGIAKNSNEIDIIKKPTYTFAYKGVEEQEETNPAGFVGTILDLLADSSQPSTGGGAADASAILLNLFGGGKDRINLLFEATNSGAPYSGASALFRSQVDYPVGAKLALCSATGDGVTTGTDSVTGKKYLSYAGTSNSSGLFRVPVCSARMPGNLLVTGTLAAGTGSGAKSLRAEANLVRFEGGLANYGNMSVAFDATNAKVMKSSFVSNSGSKMNFVARLQSILDGVLAAANPLGVLTEYGKVTLAGDGKPGVDGSIGFTVEPLNSTGQRPLRVTSKTISNGTDYDVMCTPSKFSATTPVTFSTLAKDWRSTVMYYVKGQEQYFDSNFNGQYDVANSVGFWDRNQNGAFDCTDEGVCDEITFVDPNKTDTDLVGVVAGMRPFGSPNCAVATPCVATAEKQQAIYKYDWFIDMSSPFVDGDENGDQRVLVGGSYVSQYAEYVVGDRFLVPNGRWDKEGYIWKSFVLPFYVGTSPYAMTHRTISSDLSRTFYTNGGTDIDTDSTKVGLAGFMKSSGYAKRIWDSTLTDISGTTAGGKAGVTNTLFGCWSGYNDTLPANTECSSSSIVINDDQVGSFVFPRFFFAQGTCGSPLPGGTGVKVQFEGKGVVSDTLVASGRTVSAHFYMQPNDDTVEPGRRLLAEALGLNGAKINTDPTIHPANKFGYPVQFDIKVSACDNECTGDVTTNPGVYCEAQSGTILLTADTDTIHEAVSVGAVRACGCVTGASMSKGVCKCPTGKTSDGTSCI